MTFTAEDYKLYEKWCASQKHPLLSTYSGFQVWFLLQPEIEILNRGGIIEVAIRNPSVAEYMRHWEERALKAERQYLLCQPS